MHPYLAPGLAWLVLLIGMGIFECWQLGHGKPTLSAWVWHFSKQYPWLRLVIFIVVLFLAYHFWSRG